MNSEIQKDFRVRHILVTGGSRGIGLAISRAFVQGGALVGVAATTAEAAQAVAQELTQEGPGSAYALPMDVSDFNSVKAAVSNASTKYGRPFDTLINNAGISPKAPGGTARIWDMDPDQWRRVIDVNLTGTFNCTRCVVPGMQELGRGWIVNVGSIAGKIYSPIVSCHYSASKAAIIGFTRQIAGELGEFGIRVNAVAPGRITTEMTARVSQDALKDQIAQTPMGRFGTTDEVADMAVFLSSDRSSFVTGQTIDVAGGFFMT